MRLESAKWRMVCRHVISDVGELIQSDTQVGNLGGHGKTLVMSSEHQRFSPFCS